jgi:nicotinamidase-related amidase
MAPRAATALLLVDLQKAFCDADGSMAGQGRPIEPMRAAAAASAKLAVAARVARVPVIWTRIAYRPDYLDGGRLLWDLRPNLRAAGALKLGSPDVEISAIAGWSTGEILIDKCRYSALYATPLEAQLRALGTERLVVAGVTTSMCVESTVRDLAQRDYETIVVRDACGDFDEGRHAASLEAMAFGFAELVGLEDALGILQRAEARRERVA